MEKKEQIADSKLIPINQSWLLNDARKLAKCKLAARFALLSARDQ